MSERRSDDQTKAEGRRHDLLTQPVERLVCKMAVPTVISMLVTSVYNLADTFFVGQIGSNTAIGAVGLSLSYMSAMQAFGCFYGHGSGNYISREIGGGRYEKAASMAATGFFLSVITGCVFGAVGLLARRDLCLLLGSTPTMLADTMSYMTFILMASPFLMGSYTLNNQLRLQGNSLFSMIGLASGAVMNMVLDPVFIFVLGMGVSGAALSTCVSEITSFTILLIGCKKSSNVDIRWKNFSVSGKLVREICAGGLPSLGRQGLASVSVLVLNRLAGGFGDAAIASFSVVTQIVNISSAAVLGFGQGFQPVCGFNYGAGNIDRVRKAFWFSVRLSTALLILIAVCLWFLSPSLVSIFSADPEVISLGSRILRCQILSMPILGWIIVSNMFLQNIRMVVPACIVAMSRQGIAFLPLVLALPALWGLSGLALAQPLADFVTFAISVPFTRKALVGLGAKR